MKIKFITGFFLGVLLTVAAYVIGSIVISISNTSSVEPTETIFGVNFEYGNPARKSAKTAGISIPAEANDCFYCIAGLKPVIEYVAFTVQEKDLWQTATNITGSKKAEFETPNEFPQQRTLLSPDAFGPQYKTLLFDISSPNLYVKSFNLKGSVMTQCFVDVNKNRILFSITSAD